MSKRSYLTARQRQAIILLSGFVSVREVAEQIEASEWAVKSWLKNNELFKKELDKRLEENAGIDSEKRRKMMQAALRGLYGEFMARFADERLKDISNKDLIWGMKTLQHELRVDTPEDVTGKTEHRHKKLDDLRSRYRESNSGKLFKTRIEKDPRMGFVAKKPKKKIKVIRDAGKDN